MPVIAVGFSAYFFQWSVSENHEYHESRILENQKLIENTFKNLLIMLVKMEDFCEEGFTGEDQFTNNRVY